MLLVDPRGSDGYGEAYAKALHLQGGGLQAQDVGDAALELVDLGLADPGRIAVMGHSYGAYLALRAIVVNPGVFSAGVLSSGVYDWERDYSTYGNLVRLRFGSPDAVPNLIEERNPLRRIQEIDAELLIVHGTADENAPIRASERLVTALMEAGKRFEYVAYPGEAHDWLRWETEADFGLRVLDFLARTLNRRPD